MPPKTPHFAIKNWNELYETAETRKLRSLKWVPTPIKHDGRGFQRLMMRDDGAMIFGLWVLILQVAASCPDRGVLVDSDGLAWTPNDFADKFHRPAEEFVLAFSVLSDSRIGWIVQFGNGNLLESAGVPAGSPGTPLLKERKKEGKEGREGSPLEDQEAAAGQPGSVEQPERTNTPTHPEQQPPKPTKQASAGPELPATKPPAYKPSWTADESYQPFVEAYRAAKPDAIDADFADAHHRYRQLDFEQKLTATKGVRARFEAGIWPGANPHMVPKPMNYLSRPPEWTRPIIAAPARAPARTSTPVEEMVRRAREREELRRKGGA